jgi:hypothetical protein
MRPNNSCRSNRSTHLGRPANAGRNRFALDKRNRNSGLWFFNHSGQYLFWLYPLTDRRRSHQRYRRDFNDLGFGKRYNERSLDHYRFSITATDK